MSPAPHARTRQAAQQRRQRHPVHASDYHRSEAATLNDHTHTGGLRHSARFGQLEAQTANAERLHQLGSQPLSKGFYQFKLMTGSKSQHMLANCRVIKGILQIVIGCCLTDVPGHAQIKHQPLRDGALPVIHTNHGIHGQLLDKNFVHLYPLPLKFGVCCRQAIALAAACLDPPLGPLMFITLCLGAYLLGSLSFAILLSRTHGNSDPRLHGSGNPGATNMLRLHGKRLALLTLLGDLGKGLLPVLCASGLGLPSYAQAWVGLFAVLGHLYPLYHRFRGGKGVATSAGMLLGLYPPAALLALSVWALAFFLTRTSSLASLSALPVTLPLLAWQQPQALLPISLLTLLLCWRHRQNLKHLLHGTEYKF